MTTLWEAVALEPDAATVPLRDAETAEVVVVGMGGAGLTAAAHLARAGADVLVVDRTGPGAGASGRNGGFLLGGLAPAHHEVAAVLGAERAAELYRRTLALLDAELGDVPRLGSLRVARSEDEAADCRVQLERMRADGLPVEPYEGPEGRGLVFPRDSGFRPLDRARRLAAAAVAAGARLRTAEVADVAPYGVRTSGASTADGVGLPSPGVLVRATRGVLVAVDGGLEQLVPAVAGRTRSARLQMVATAPARDVVVPRPVYARWGLDYWQQLPDGRIALGGGRDVGGEDEWTTRAEPSAPVQAHLDRLLREDIGTAAPVEHRWAGVVGMSSDGLPVLHEQVTGDGRLLAVGGYSGTGNLVGPLCATWASDRLLGRPSDLAALLAR